MNEPLTATDLSELERILIESGVGDSTAIERAKAENEGLGLFVRSLIGLDREAAKRSFASFLHGKNFAANQIEFVDILLNHLTERGVVDVAALYDSPYTDVSPQGPDSLFEAPEVEQIVEILHQVRERAIA